VPPSEKTTASNGNSLDSWTGYKAQPWPAATWTEAYRFEKDDKAVGLIYNAPATGNARWIDEQMTLKFGYHSLTGATILSLVAGISVLYF